jgi:hypothetical protein
MNENEMSDKTFSGIMICSIACATGIALIIQYWKHSLLLTGGVAILAMIFFMFFFAIWLAHE